MEKKLIGIVVLFWNDFKKTIKCIESIYCQKNLQYTLVLVDNNSEKEYSNKIYEWLKNNQIEIVNVTKKKYEENKFGSSKICFYIKNEFNYGCGLGHNPGYQFCIDNNLKYIARIDNDMIVPQNTIKNLVNRLENNNFINGISPKIMFVKRPNFIWWRGSTVGNNLKFQKNCATYSANGHLDDRKFEGMIKTDAICGCASIMKTERLKKIGLSDPDFFYGEEDIELSYRLAESNESLWADLDEKIYHHVSGTVGKNWAKNVYYNYKYRLVLIKKIGNIYDKFFGYSFAILKLFLSLFLFFDKHHSSRFLQRYYAIIHFFQKKYGSYDRINYNKIDNFFNDITKKTNSRYVLKKINSYKF
tara:strand:+ start:10420 stop:11496 length:1077 start_codon:yes stop_codon:yes gene_type:complete